MRRGCPELRPAGATKPLGWGPARYFEFPDALGTVGFISPLSRHFCSECNRLRVTADGKVRPCLFSDTEYDVRTALREGDDAAVRDVLLTALGRQARRPPRQSGHRPQDEPDRRLAFFRVVRVRARGKGAVLRQSSLGGTAHWAVPVAAELRAHPRPEREPSSSKNAFRTC